VKSKLQLAQFFNLINDLSERRVSGRGACVFFWHSGVCIGSMNATVCYFVSAMADEKAEIARGLRRHDPDLLDQLIEKYQHRLLRFLVQLTGRREQAEDFFQETWIRVLERGHQYDGRHEFSTWLFTVARNLVIDNLRRRRPTSFDSMTGPEDAAPFDIPATGQPSAFDATVQREQNEQISAGMLHIAAEYRETLVLRFQEGMSLEEIAHVTGAPLGTVKSRIYRGLSALEPWLKGARL
jgi:RNA polymerase sigma-70 factor (ECF subfamily)